MEWQERAKRLSFGQKRKIPHCTPDASAYINNSPKGVSIHCFRCGHTDWEPHGRLSASEIIAMQRQEEEELNRPYPEVTPLYGEGVPVQAHVWVLRAGITPERATDEYGFGWSERMARVVVPILHNGGVTGQYTARSLTPGRPKYVMPKGSVGASWYAGLQQAGKASAGTCGEMSRKVVVVEDVLSAIRINEAGYGSYAVLGTSVGRGQGTDLANSTVYGWFDGDKAGRDGWVKLRKALGLYGVEPTRIQTAEDPKAYSLADIRKHIEDAT